MNSTARLVLVTVCTVLVLCVVDQILSPWFGKLVPESIVKHTEAALAFLGGVLAQTRDHASPPSDPATD